MDYTVDYFKERLTDFITNNPKSNIIERKVKDIVHIILEEPWEDDSISIRLSTKNAEQLIDALNFLLLPPNFTCIYHTDRKILEFIWGAQAKDSEYTSRTFEYNFSGRSYKCYFDKASDRLELLAKHAIQRKYYSPSEHRNLLYLREYYQDIQKGSEPTENLTPISFFIEGMDSFDESLLTEISKNLNFYLHYFDRESPIILIHARPPSPEFVKKPVQYIDDAFPNIIISKSKDPLLLDLMSAALESDVRMSYLYCYQVIERAAHFHLNDITKSTLNKILNSPDIQANTDTYINRIVEAIIQDAKSDDESKIEKVVLSLCSPATLWKEISANIEFFSKPTSFDGGFAANPIIDESSSYDYFCSCWHPSLANQLRHIRNALAHGRERMFGPVIHPTENNDQLLLPWASLIRRVAEQIIIYSTIY